MVLGLMPFEFLRLRRLIKIIRIITSGEPLIYRAHRFSDAVAFHVVYCLTDILTYHTKTIRRKLFYIYTDLYPGADKLL